LSPAFFRPEVLAKYKGDSDKYRVDDRAITCRGAWHLKGFDINEEGQIHAYIVDLRNLPHEEQLHWKAYNEPPKGGISKRAYDADMLGSWTSYPNPLLDLKNLLREWHRKQVGWWVLRSDKLCDSVNYPVTPAADEWANDLMQLDKLIIEGFSSKWLRSLVDRLGASPPSNPVGSLNLLKQCLTLLCLGETDANALLEPLRTLQNHRSKLKGHVEGAEALSLKREALKNFGTYRSHFSSLCEKCHESLAAIGEALSQTTVP